MKKTKIIASRNIKIVAALSIFIAVISVVVMLGWIFGIDQMTRIIPFGSSMKFFSAFMFFFSAIGLFNIALVIKGDYEVPDVLLTAVALINAIIIISIVASRIFLDPQISFEQQFVRPDSASGLLASGQAAIATLIAIALFSAVCIVALFPGQYRQAIIKYFGIALVTITTVHFLLLGQSTFKPLRDLLGVDLAVVVSTLVLIALGAGLIIIGKEKKTNED